MKNTTLQNLIPFIAAFIAAIGMILGAKMSGKGEFYRLIDENKDYAIYEALQHIDNKYYGDIDNVTFNNEIITAVTEELDDYTHYWSPIRNRKYQDYVNGSYLGRGIDIVTIENEHYISQVIKDSPAEDAGLKWGDRIAEINGILGSSIQLDSINQLLRISDTLFIKAERGKNRNLFDLKVAHGVVELNPIKSVLLDSEILYLRISKFSKGVFRLFMDEFELYKVGDKKVDRIILDLRGNPGGVVEETTKILNQLVKESNQLLISTIDNKNRVKSFKSNGRGFLDIEKIVVLIDEESASASEILAGSIQDLDIGVIIGQVSYGKGEIQQNYRLSNGSSISLTVGEYLLPTGRSISKNRNDTTEFFTVRNQRKLKSYQGVLPDLILNYHDQCDLQEGIDWKNKSFTLLKEKNFTSKGRLIDSDVTDYLNEVSLIVDAPCRQYFKAQMLDYLATVGLLQLESIKGHYLSNDSTVLNAFNIINSAYYEELLEY